MEQYVRWIPEVYNFAGTSFGDYSVLDLFSEMG